MDLINENFNSIIEKENSTENEQKLLKIILKSIFIAVSNISVVK